MPTTYTERWANNMADIAGQIGKSMAEKKRKREMDLIAQEVAEQYGLEGIDSAEELKMALTLRSSDMERQLKQAQIQRALREPPPVDEEGLTPYQRRQLELSSRREERLSQPRARTMTPLQELQAEKLKRELAAEVAAQTSEPLPEEVTKLDAKIQANNVEIAKGNKYRGWDWLEENIAKKFPSAVTTYKDYNKGFQAERDVLAAKPTQTVTPKVAEAKYIPGRVYAGLRYKGGDPNNEANWEPAR